MKINDEKDCPTSSMPNVCPYCKEEDCLDQDNNSLKIEGTLLTIPATCNECGKKSELIYHVEFDQIEGREI